MGQKERAKNMFNSISNRYDFLNHLLSLRFDVYWRKRVTRLVKKLNPETILDIATGTGDLAIAEASLPVKEIIGIDIAKNMLEIAEQKIKKKGLSDRIIVELGDVEDLRFKDNSFDVATCSFGVRNFENINKGLSEIYRVLNDNGSAIILEFSKPTSFPIKQLYGFYFSNILPVIGKVFSRHDSAYRYLPESVKAFPNQEIVIELLKNAGFEEATYFTMTFGIVTVYQAKKLS